MKRSNRFEELCKADEQVRKVIEHLRRLDRKPRKGYNDKHICCICGETYYGYGNNPAPVKKEGRCCDACNWDFVIPAKKGKADAEAVK